MWVALLALAGGLAPAARADRVTSAEQIHIGVQDHAMPFAYRLGQRHLGYSVELCQRVVLAIEAQRGKPYANAPDQRWVSVTSRTRLLRLLAGDIDLECGSTSATPARVQLGLAFSPPIFVSDLGVLMRTDAGPVPASAELWRQQLRQRRAVLVTTEGSTSVRHLARLNSGAGGPLFQVVYGRDHEHSLQLLRDGAAEAFVMDRALLAARWATDERLRLAGITLAVWSPLPAETETYGIVMRDGDDDLKRIVRQTLCALARSPDGGPSPMQQLHERWFNTPIEVAGSALPQALALAMHADLARRLAAPAAGDCPG